MNVSVADTRYGFTRLEMLVSILIVGLVMFVSTGMTRPKAHQRAACFNNLRQINAALLAYADDHDDNFPPRLTNPNWPERLRLYFNENSILACPSDGENPRSFSSMPFPADVAPRSYIFNGWNDYFASRNGGPLFGRSFPQSAITEPAQTIVFGEKETFSAHFWYDYETGDDFSALENGRHDRVGNATTSGSSNHAFADGSVRLLKWGTAFNPVNLWFVEPQFRTNYPGF